LWTLRSFRLFRLPFSASHATNVTAITGPAQVPAAGTRGPSSSRSRYIPSAEANRYRWLYDGFGTRTAHSRMRLSSRSSLTKSSLKFLRTPTGQRVTTLSSKCFPPPTAPRVIARHKRRRGDLHNIIYATVEEAVANVEISKEKEITKTR